MKKLKFLSALLVLSAAIAFTSSCEKSTPTPDPVTTGAYVLNNGNWGSNDANIGRYNPETRQFESDIFLSRNGKKLGDLAQDMIITGSRMLIAVSDSKIIFVTDTTCQILKEITCSAGGSALSPRKFAATGNKVYVSYYEGYLGEIDLDTYAVRTVAVGPNPEGVAVLNGKIYVANSGGMNYPDYNNTMSIVNADSFTVEKTVEVVLNPSYMCLDETHQRVYLASIGNYADITPTLQMTDAAGTAMTVIPDVQPSWMTIGPDGTMYIISSLYDAEWNPIIKVLTFDTATNTVTGEFITDGTTVPGACSINADPVSGNIYIGTSDYTTNGDMYVFSPAGKLLNKFDTGGLNPMGVYFLTK